MKSQVTHLALDERHRRLMAMRSAQLGMSLSEYISQLVASDSERAGLVQYLAGTSREAPRGE